MLLSVEGHPPARRGGSRPISQDHSTPGPWLGHHVRMERPPPSPSQQEAHFKQRWRNLPLRERVRIRWAVSQGRTLTDPGRAALAAGLARQWLDSPWLKPAGIALQLAIVAAVAVGFWFLVPPDRRWLLFVGLVLGLGGALSAPRVFRQAEQSNREIARRGDSNETTTSS
jgi:hypothetical protein